MKILVSGSSGLIGSALASSLSASRQSVTRLVRPGTRPGSSEVVWDPAAGRLEAGTIEDFDAVVHLAGENVAGARWTAKRKKILHESRVKSTRLLAEALAKLSRPPRALLSASATGYYGDRGNETLTEGSGPGSGFLADLCHAWEESSKPASAAGIRVVNLRLGVVLSSSGGALPMMLPPFKAGLGGPIGTGEQYLSWVTLDDAVNAIQHALLTDSLVGAVNLVAPEPVTNREFAHTLGRVLHRPAFLPLPAFAVRLFLGEMGNDLLLAGARVIPARLGETGYRFLHPSLEGALRHLLARD